MPDPTPPDGFPADSENEPPGSDLWVEEPAGPDPPGGRPESPDAGIDPAKATPGRPGYDPHWDPNVHNPEIPVPGLDPTAPIVDPGGNADGHIDYPDQEAPVDPATVLKNLQRWAAYALLLYEGRMEDGPPRHVLGAASLDGLRYLVRLVLQDVTRPGAPPCQYQVIDLNAAPERWFDPSLDPAEQGRWPAGWNGVMNAGVRYEGGLGDRL